MIKKEFIFLLMVTFIVLMIWVIANVIHTKSQVAISSSLQDALDPVDPNFDTSTLTKVGQIPQTPSQSTSPQSAPLPNPTPQPLPSASTSALLSPNSSPSANLSNSVNTSP